LRLLFDQNLSPHLVRRLATDFPDSLHVRDLGLERATDGEVWERARRDQLTLVTKDADFRGLPGPPPRWIWVRLGNSTTDDIEQLLRLHRISIEAFADADQVLIALP
jgi:predicted nuclease of predicted toxin-antitoxin system